MVIPCAASTNAAILASGSMALAKLVVGIAIITIFPVSVTWLPDYLMGKPK